MTIQETVLKFASKTYQQDLSTLSEDTVLREIGANSIKTIGFKTLLEETYDITITIPESGSCKTLGDFVELVTKKVEA